MKRITLISLLICVCISLQAQTNFVKNSGFESYFTCPDQWNQINYCKYWSIPGDSTTTNEYCSEYFNSCGNISPDPVSHIPDNLLFFQFPHSGNGLVGSTMFYDKTLPSHPVGIVPFNYRDNLVGRLHKNLALGHTYCVTFWIIMAESSGVGHNKIGAYLDDGSINNMIDTFGEEINDINPQVYSDDVIKDTLNWIKIEGSFVANGTEKYISIGNFFPNDSVTTVTTNYRMLGTQYSYYLIDDVSVIPIDLEADAGKDSHAEPGKPVQIGRVGDTTAMGLDCKWYYKEALIDSGAVISVNGSAIVGTIDTYVVIQTICGLIKSDTVTVKTVPLGMKEWGADQSFTVYPNPSSGTFTITQTNVIPGGGLPAGRHESVTAVVYDLLGRIVVRHQLAFKGNDAQITIQASKGNYILELIDSAGNTAHQQIVIE